MDVQTTLNFYGRTEEAVAFYGRALGAETLFLMRFRDSADPARSKPALAEKIFHATFRVGATEIMASDCGCENPAAQPNFAGFSLALHADTAAKAEQFFTALSDGGQVQISLGKTFFSDRYGIVLDRFGVSWKVMVAADSKRKAGDGDNATFARTKKRGRRE